MSLKFRAAFWGIVAAQLLLLLWLIGVKEYTLFAGTTVVLQTVPLDPRSLFQGDHVVLRYEISPLPPYLSHLSKGDTVYVSLVPHGDVWKAKWYDTSPPSHGSLFIKGTVGDRNLVDFGIGTYFVPEGSGHAIERARDVKVRVSLDGSGNAIIKRLIVNGRPFNPGEPGSPTSASPGGAPAPVPAN